MITFYDTETPPWTSEKHKINDEVNCLKLEDFFNSGYPYFDVQDERIIKLLKHNLAILGVSEKDSNNSINQSLIESIFEYKQNELSSSLEDYYDEKGKNKMKDYHQQRFESYKDNIEDEDTIPSLEQIEESLNTFSGKARNSYF